jgi:DNA-binding XRE family transcriptional regulator
VALEPRSAVRGVSRDATGLYSSWAERRVLCPVCAAPPGKHCDLTRSLAPTEHGVHFARTEADELPIPAHATEHCKLDLAKAYGEEIAALRALHNMRKTEVARLVGIAARNYVRSESGVHTPSLETMIRVAEVFRIQPVELFRRIHARATERAYQNVEEEVA